MSTNMEQLKETLYGKEGLGASNFKLFPGTNRETSSEEMAEEILRVLNALKAESNPESLID